MCHRLSIMVSLSIPDAETKRKRHVYCAHIKYDKTAERTAMALH